MANANGNADWNMEAFFSGVKGEDFRGFRDALLADIDALESSLEGAAPVAEATDAWSNTLQKLEDLGARYTHLRGYLECVASADARDQDIKSELGALATTSARYDKLLVVLRSHLRELDDNGLQTLLDREELAPVSYYIVRQRQESLHSMGPSEEKLASELAVDGLHAWGRLYDQITGNLSFNLEVEGRAAKEVPVAMTRSLLEDADPKVRRAAFDGSAKAWDSVSETLAACLNAIAGTRLKLYDKRGVEHFLAPALHDAGIEKDTLDAMWSAVRERQPMIREFLQRKGKILGSSPLGFWDQMAPLPLGNDEERVSWDKAQSIVVDAFSSAYPALGELAKTAFDGAWIDHSPRSGKRPGGFCSPSPVAKESRIFMTFNGAMGDVQTLAHELGHSFHSYLMRNMRPWAQEYPMTLAETASTFGENVVTSAALARTDATDEERLGILHQRMDAAVAFLLNIPTRFDFESKFYEQRQSGELSVDQLKKLMVEAQKKNYGEAIAEDGFDPWFWASKLHFFITDLSFYNFPYTFGYLFSTGIFKRFVDEGSDFLPSYEKLLRMTGSATAEEVAQECLGVDLRKPDFWNAAIDLVADDYKAFCELAGKLGK